MMTPEEYRELVEDIKANGLKVEIETYQGKIIDGRNRFLACQEAGVKPRFKKWDEVGSLISHVVSLNMKRRHLQHGQRSMIADKLRPLFAEEAKAHIKAGGGDQKSQKAKSGTANMQNPVSPIETAVEAAKMMGVSSESVYEVLHPETRTGTSQALGMHKSLGHNVAEKTSATFSEDTAAKLGVNPRTVRLAVQIARDIERIKKGGLQ